MVPFTAGAVKKAKDTIVQAVENGVKHFEVERPTCLATDFSNYRLGFFF